MGAFLFSYMKYLLIFLLLPLSLFAQKKAEQTFDIEGIQAIEIDSDLIFKITMHTQPVTSIQLNTVVDGETYASTLVNAKVVDDRLEIRTGRTPDFTPFNDKLSAHKVLSIELEMIIPENMDVDIKSTLAEVHLGGLYGKLQIDLGRGGLIGRGVRFRKSVINTISGNITLALTQANVIAGSRNGIVKVAGIFNDGPLCVIQSIHGNIDVLQVK